MVPDVVLIFFFMLIYDSLILKWHRYLKSFFMEDKDIPILHYTGMAVDDLVMEGARVLAKLH